MAARERRPTGRPPAINQLLRTLPDGTKVTVADDIINTLRLCPVIEVAAAKAGIHRDTVHHWLKTAAQARTRITTPKDTDIRRLSRFETMCCDFSDNVDRVIAEYELTRLARIERRAQGGEERITITIKVDADGNEVERTSRTERLLPDVEQDKWLLARRLPARYSSRVEVTGPEGEALIPTEDRAAALAAALQAFQNGADAQRALDAERESANGNGTPAAAP